MSSIRNIALSVGGGLVLIAILVLFVQVRSAPAKPNPQKVLEAQQKYQRSHTQPSAGNLDGDPWARSTPPPSEVPDRPSPRVGLDTTPMVRDEEASAPPPSVAPMPDVDSDPRLERSTAKDEANRLYDKQDYDGALQKALAVLAEEPGDIRMLRVVVSSACQLGDADKAKQYWAQLPPHDQNQMTRRCQRFGITFAEQ